MKLSLHELRSLIREEIDSLLGEKKRKKSKKRKKRKKKKHPWLGYYFGLGYHYDHDGGDFGDFGAGDGGGE